jgi:hypothetical protein
MSGNTRFNEKDLNAQVTTSDFCSLVIKQFQRVWFSTQCQEIRWAIGSWYQQSSAYNTITGRLFLPEITLKKHLEWFGLRTNHCPLIPGHIMTT